MDKKVKKKKPGEPVYMIKTSYKIINIATCFNSQNKQVEMFALTECQSVLKRQDDKWILFDDNLKDYNGN